jgi:glycosyltransferase involved in cell wall biosynthesis
MDIVALTSLNEGTPLTLIEAMACGRPVLATEVGGVVDIMGERQSVEDGFVVWDHGVTVKSEDSRAFARALSFLIERPQLRREMGRRGRAFIGNNYSKNRLITRIEGLYRELAGLAVESMPSAEAQAAARSR